MVYKLDCVTNGIQTKKHRKCFLRSIVFNAPLAHGGTPSWMDYSRYFFSSKSLKNGAEGGSFYRRTDPIFNDFLSVDTAIAAASEPKAT